MLISRKLPTRIFGAAALLLVAGCGKEPDDSDTGSLDLPSLSGKLVYVDGQSGVDRLFTSESSDASNSRELQINDITVQPPHEAGSSNITAHGVASIERVVWNDDATRVAVIVSRLENQSQLIVLDPSNGHAFTASDQTGSVRSPHWSPDGRKLAYVQSHQDSLGGVLASTEIDSGSVELFQETAPYEITAVAWDAESTGIYYYVAAETGCAFFHLDVSSDASTCVEPPAGGLKASGYPQGLPQDITRDGGVVWGTEDPEFTALFYRDLGAEYANPVQSGRALLYGWFLASAGVVVGIEETNGSFREAPLIARFDPGSPANGDRFRIYAVNAPVAFKWDFHEAAK